MALAMGCVAFAFVDRDFIWGGLFILASFGYYAAIHWMDKHGQWK